MAAFEVNVIVMNSEGNTILQTPQNAIFFKTCQQGEHLEPLERGLWRWGVIPMACFLFIYTLEGRGAKHRVHYRYLDFLRL